MDEHLGGNDLARLALVMRRMTTHAEGLRGEHHRSVAGAAPIRGQLGGGKGIEHIVSVEGPPRHAVRLVKFLEGSR